MNLASLAQGRNNNFNLIRLIAAFAVLFSHSFSLATGLWDSEPLRNSLGITPGMIAVDIFFIASGFLVTGSLISRNNVIGFAVARILRIYPALIIMVLITGIFGAFYTSLSPSSYYNASIFWTYILKNISLVTGLTNNLPGVFTQNPIKNAVNGSLWTLIYEIKMYILLAIIWTTLKPLPINKIRAFSLIVALFALCARIMHFFGHYNTNVINNELARLSFMFFCGSVFYMAKDHIKLSHSIFAILITALTLSSTNKELFFITYQFTISYLLFYIAYIPKGVILKYNKIGDYSYGIYIYAFPIQQALLASQPGISIEGLFLSSSAITLIFAILSWHFIECKAMKLKFRPSSKQ